MADEVGLGLRGVAKLAEGERLLIPETRINTKEASPLCYPLYYFFRKRRRSRTTSAAELIVQVMG